MMFTYQDFLALTLIYTANASDGISPEEYEFIVNKAGGNHYEKAFSYFETASEVEVIEKIDELANDFARDEDQREKVCADIKEMIAVDVADKAIEEQILRMIRKII